MDEIEGEIIKAFRIAEKREEAFGLLMRTYQQKLYAHLRRMLGNHPDADDALQNTFVKTWGGLENFKAESALYSWLYRIATNEALSLLEKRKRTQGHTSIEAQQLGAQSDGPDSVTIERKLESALQLLPPRQRQVFDFRYFEEMPYEEMAQITGLSVGALKASYFHAVKKVEQYLSA